MHANSIDEYLEAKSKGFKNITFSISDKELTDFVMNDIQMSEVQLLNKYEINTTNNQYFYTENSIFPFGKHRGNLLKFVYKCDPGYIEWCLLEADSFCIAERTINIFSRIKVWNAQDLIFSSNAEGDFVLDLRNFQNDEEGYPFSTKLREIPFIFSKTALDSNLRKLEEKLNPYTVLRGSNWSDNRPIYSKPKKRVKILF